MKSWWTALPVDPRLEQHSQPYSVDYSSPLHVHADMAVHARLDYQLVWMMQL